jgi:anti-anti-sigma factor
VITPVSVSVACFDNEVWIRVEGRGNFQSSGSIKRFVHAMIQRGHRKFVVDLGACEHMDSTFMGTLTGISQNLRELGQGLLLALNVSTRNVELLENLGLNFLFDVEPLEEPARTPAEEGAELMPLPLETGHEKAIVLSAHEALIAANPANAARFKDVIEYLKKAPDEPSEG